MGNNAVKNSIVLIGASNSGKSHFGAQFEIRLALSKGALRRLSLEGDTSLFKGVKDNLYLGMASQHTPTGTKTKKTLSIVAEGGEQFDLVWQDYAGEQIHDVFAQRRIGDAWRKDIERSESWVLFVRASDIKVKKDPISQVPNRFVMDPAPDPSAPSAPKFEYSDQTTFVELLQLLLYVRGTRLGPLFRSPRLTVVLTCWDEIDTAGAVSAGPHDAVPVDVLRKYAPMLLDFIRNNWDPAAWMVIGLSSLGQQLSTSRPDAKFAALGPEKAGFVILEDGSSSPDLTLPVAVGLTHP